MYIYYSKAGIDDRSKRPVHLWPVDDFDPRLGPGIFSSGTQEMERVQTNDMSDPGEAGSTSIIWWLQTKGARVNRHIEGVGSLFFASQTRNSLHLSPVKMKRGKQHCAALSLCILAPTVLLTYLRFLFRREVIHDVELLANLLKLGAAKFISLIGFHGFF